MVNFGLLMAEICWRVWGIPAHFNGFRVLAALLHGTLVVGVSQTLRRWTEGATYIPQGGHHVGHRPTFLVITFIGRFVRSLRSWLLNEEESWRSGMTDGTTFNSVSSVSSFMVTYVHMTWYWSCTNVSVVQNLFYAALTLRELRFDASFVLYCLHHVCAVNRWNVCSQFWKCTSLQEMQQLRRAGYWHMNRTCRVPTLA